MIICDYGCGEPATYQFNNGKWCCSEHYNKCAAARKANSDGVKAYAAKHGNNRWHHGHPKGSKGGTSLKGKTYEEIYGAERAQEMKQKLSETNTGKKHVLDEATKQRVSDKARERINQRYAEGWMPKAGRCRKITYTSPVAGTVSLDGSWELAAAQHFDKIGVNWKRNTQRFPYMDGDKARFYTPDFWVEDWQTFIEVKGYETQLDRKKWAQFTKALTVWGKEHINTISNGETPVLDGQVAEQVDGAPLLKE